MSVELVDRRHRYSCDTKKDTRGTVGPPQHSYRLFYWCLLLVVGIVLYGTLPLAVVTHHLWKNVSQSSSQRTKIKIQNNLISQLLCHFFPNPCWVLNGPEPTNADADADVNLCTVSSRKPKGGGGSH